LPSSSAVESRRIPPTKLPPNLRNLRFARVPQNRRAPLFTTPSCTFATTRLSHDVQYYCRLPNQPSHNRPSTNACERERDQIRVYAFDTLSDPVCGRGLQHILVSIPSWVLTPPSLQPCDCFALGLTQLPLTTRSQPTSRISQPTLLTVPSSTLRLGQSS